MEIRFDGHSLLDKALNESILGDLFPASTAVHQFCPSVDINETKEAFEVIVEVPGVTKEDLKVSIHNNILSISGKRRVVTDEGKRPIVTEISRGDFSRRFKLPASVNIDGTTTEYSNGVLRINLPKQELSKTKDIPIQ